MSEPIRTPWSADSTALDVVADRDLTGLRAIVTGATSGLGIETARALSAAGAEVWLAVRDAERGAAVAAELDRTAEVPPHVLPLELADPASVDALAAGWTGPLHLLVNNAGVVTAGLERTVQGHELQFATNHLGHLGLASGLHDALRAGAEDRGEARIVALSSGAHMRSPVVFEDIDFEHRAYDPQLAYAQSKTADVLFAVGATARWAGGGVFANAVNPGGIRTGLQRHFSQRQRESLDAMEAAGVFAYRTPQQGAATTLVAAVAPEFARVGGRYLDDGQEAPVVPDDTSMADAPHAVKRWAMDPEAAERLWRVSEAMLAG